MEGKQVARRGFPLLTALVIVLAILKLAGVAPFARWSWWWVFAPWWGPFAAFAGILVIIGVGWIVAVFVDVRPKRRRS